jgi:sulfur carrier protein ThiS
MRIIVNQIEYELPSQSMIADVLNLINAKPPFAVGSEFELYSEVTICSACSEMKTIKLK